MKYTNLPPVFGRNPKKSPKIRIVPSSAVTSRRLDATHYVDPTHKIDARIARERKTIAMAQQRLAALLDERDAILREQAGREWVGEDL